jgi:hypothetical protein
MKNIVSKSFLLTAIVAVSLSACKDRNEEKRIAEMEAQAKHQKVDNQAEGPAAKFEFATTSHDFGIIHEGDSAVYVYEFKNTSDVPLIIESVKPSCGCTIPNYTKTPVAAGGSGFVKVKFDSNGKSNKVHKSVTVTANTSPRTTELTFEAMILPKEGGK